MQITNQIFIIVVIFGYSIWENLFLEKNLRIANTNINSSYFIGRRFIQLSTVSLLLSAYFFYNPTKITYLCVSFIHLCIYIMFPIKWKVTPKNALINYITHILSGLPVLLYPLYGTFTQKNKYDKIEILLTVILLIMYYFLQNYIYKR